ncbi:MAG: LysM peptidoglycan-binding domain-containing protein [Firmicutes bacterium]|nr:LysM peptidoglycan-binding domain-containing protein [Bacillota bacterium]
MPPKAAFAACCLALGLTAAGAAPAAAAPPSTYTVRAGDTLSAIAARFGLSLTALERLNGLGPASVLRIGEVLHLPAPRGSETAGRGGSVYVVRAGDTLSAIAARLGVSLAALERANGLGPTSLLQIGQRLTIPGAAAPAAPARSTTGSGAVYVVRPGDTLSGIAQRTGVPLSRLYALNGLGPDSVLQIGQRLRLGPQAAPRALSAARPHATSAAVPASSPSYYRVQAGDTLSSIAARLGVSLAALVQVNPGVNPADLQIGQLLQMPSTAAAAQAALSFGDRVVAEARRFLGVPYVYGGSSPSGFDCSGLVWYVLNLVGVRVPRDATDQFYAGRPVPRGDLQPGDVVFFDTTGGISHDGIYIGNGEFIHAPAPGQSVRVDSLNNPYWQATFLGAKSFAP